MNKYFKPKSLTFWSGLVLALIPVLKAFGVEVPFEKEILSIAGGTGLVGLRKAMDGKPS